ncbi:MAG: hypothetical protein ABSH04_06760 [Acidimicrobiales bacterium]|jgi:hypothetical protein
MSGSIVVENDTGRVIHVSGCGALFQVALANNKYRPTVAWHLCLETITIPIGKSTYAVKVEASYLGCTQGRPQGAFKACLSDGKPPALPPGDYHARLFQSGNIVAVPPAITVRVTP